MAAPAFGTAGTYLTGSSTTSAAVAVPASVAAGDIILVHLYKENTAAVAAPDGTWTQVTNSPVATTGSVTQQSVWWKRATAADSGTYTFTWAGAAWREAVATRYTGAVSVGTPTEVNNFAQNSTSGTATPTVSGTTTGADRLLVWGATNFNGGGTVTAPGGYTARAGAFTGLAVVGTLGVATNPQAVAGATGSIAGSWNISDVNTASLVALIPDTGSATTSDPAPFAWNPPGLGRGPRSIPQPWFGVADTGAAQSPAEGGSGTVGGATTATEVKVAKVAGSCAVGFAPVALETKLAPQTGSATVGTAETAVEKKSAPETGTVTVGAGGTGVESTALTAATRPAVSVVTAPRTPAYARSQPALILNGFIRGQSAPAAERGSANIGTATTATEVKVAKVAGTCSVGAIGVGTEKKVAVSVGAEPVGTVITGAEKKVAPEQGAGGVGFAVTRSGLAVRAQTGVATVGAWAGGLETATTTARRSPAVTVVTAQPSATWRITSTPLILVAPTEISPPAAQGGTATFGAPNTATPRKVAAVTGICGVGTSGTGGAQKVAAGRGTVVVGLSGSRSGIVARQVTGTATLGAAGTGTARKVASAVATATAGLSGSGVDRKVGRATGTAAVAGTATGAARKVIAQRGTAAVGFTGTRSGVFTRAVTGIAALGTGARATETKAAAPAGVAALGTSGRGTVAKAVGSSGRVTLGLSGSAAAARRIATTGRTCVGLSGGVETIFTLDFHPRGGVVVDTADRRFAGTVVDTADRDTGVAVDTADRHRGDLAVAGPRIRADAAVNLAERYHSS